MTKIEPVYSLEVTADAFSQAIKTITKKSKKKDPGRFEISYLMGQMFCRGLDDAVTIPAKGDWPAPVSVSPVAMKKIAHSLTGDKILHLGYRDERFYIDGFSIPAHIRA